MTVQVQPPCIMECNISPESGLPIQAPGAMVAGHGHANSVGWLGDAGEMSESGIFQTSVARRIRNYHFVFLTADHRSTDLLNQCQISAHMPKRGWSMPPKFG